MARTLVDKIKGTSNWQSRIGQPWTTSGVLTASAVIKAEPGVFGGVLVIATDTGGDIDVIVWDSPTATLTDDERLCRVTIPSTVANTMDSFGNLDSPGIEATLGMYVQIVAGDCQVYVYYR